MDRLIDKKGILLTLGIVFISLTILAFANLILKNSETSESRIKEFAETERIHNIKSSISLSMDRFKDNVLGDYLDISQTDNVIEFKTKFTGQGIREETEALQQMSIFNERLQRKSYINFTDDSFPFLDRRSVFAEGSAALITTPSAASRLNTSRFYLKYNPDLYISYSSWPYNFIYLNRFNSTNTEEINFTFKSQTIYPHPDIVPNLVVASAGCPGSECILFRFNTYYQGSLITQQEFYVDAGLLGDPTHPTYGGLTDGSATSKFVAPSSDIGYHEIFHLNVSNGPTVSNVKNRTIIFNWLNVDSHDGLLHSPTDKSFSGIAIVFPSLSVTAPPATMFNWLYHGLQHEPPAIGDYIDILPSDVIDIELQIKLKDAAAKHYGRFVSPTSYNIEFPHLETRAANASVEYLA